MMSRRSFIISIVALLCFFAILLCFENIDRATNYNRLIGYIRTGDYSKAFTLAYDEFYHQRAYEDSHSLSELAIALYYYDMDYVSDAWRHAKNVGPLSFLTEEEQSQLDDFLLRLQEENAAQSSSNIKQTNIYSKTIPFVGMDIANINDTSLGQADRHEHSDRYDTYYFNGENGLPNFVAYCTDGKVFSIHDTRDQVKPDPSTYMNSLNDDDNEDPYDVNSYRNEEDFYDDNYYHFSDYYEAERYYNEHHD